MRTCKYAPSGRGLSFGLIQRQVDNLTAGGPPFARLQKLF